MAHGQWVRRAAVLAAGLTATAAAVLGPLPAAQAAGEGYLDVTVQGPDGSPLGGASVTIYEGTQVNPDPVNDPGWHPASLASEPSGVDGVAHFVQPIPDGQTVLQVRIQVEMPGYFSEWYQAAATYSEALKLSISDGTTNTATVALAQKLRQVSVYTYDADSGDDVVGAEVGLYPVDGDGSVPSVTATTNGSGTAHFQLAVGSPEPNFYRVRATRAGYLDQWFVDPPGSANTFDNAVSLDLTGETGSLHADLAMTAGQPLDFTSAPKPTIAGKARKGVTLKARTGDWAPAPTTFRYRWYRGSHPITGATARTYPLRKADVGKRISVKVKASRPGYVTTTRTSARTAPVRP